MVKLNSTEMLKKLNSFTQKELTLDDVYIYKVRLCDNDIDRDVECFSDASLLKLKDLFVGKTGIFDHNVTATGQVSRIFDTEVVTENTKLTTDGRVYKWLQGYAYIMKTQATVDLIKEIDGGIKKEVSVSCSANSHKCSICGRNRLKDPCSHIKRKHYNGNLCYTILDDITDAYEWSFVAVPAQVNAGVIKNFVLEDKSSTVEDNKFQSNTQNIRLKVKVLKKKGVQYEH